MDWLVREIEVIEKEKKAAIVLYLGTNEIMKTTIK